VLSYILSSNSLRFHIIQPPHTRADPPPPCLALLDMKMQEALYLSSKREPLGRPVERGHVLPEAVKGAGTHWPKVAAFYV
jgi:hypothetical protein